MIICPKCKHTINSDYLFCPKCGENLKNCCHCGKELPEEANFCPYCGKPAKSETTIATNQSQNSAVCSQQKKTESTHADKAKADSWKISKEAHDDIVKRFLQMNDKHIGSRNSSSIQWTKSETIISLSNKWEHWVGHDDTISKDIDIAFSKVWQRIDNVPWNAESEWPCNGQALLFDKSWSNESDAPWDSHYSYENHKAWLLKEPYGMHGIRLMV